MNINEQIPNMKKNTFLTLVYPISTYSQHIVLSGKIPEILEIRVETLGVQLTTFTQVLSHQ
jgi:hypothetical protein